MIDLQQLKKKIVPVCKKFKIKRMELFGSYATGTDNRDSDMDFLVEFENPEEKGISKRYFGLYHFLEDTFGKHIDLLTPSSIKNPYLKKSIDSVKVSIYG